MRLTGMEILELKEEIGENDFLDLCFSYLLKFGTCDESKKWLTNR